MIESKECVPKMLKNVGDECYGKQFNQLDACRCCWLRRSCEANYKANVKKEKTLKRGKEKVVREKKYKKTAKYREWF